MAPPFLQLGISSDSEMDDNDKLSRSSGKNSMSLTFLRAVIKIIKFIFLVIFIEGLLDQALENDSLRALSVPSPLSETPSPFLNSEMYLENHRKLQAVKDTLNSLTDLKITLFFFF